MNLTWMKWNVLAAAVLMAGTVAMAQDKDRDKDRDKDKPAPSSQPAPREQDATPPKEWTPTTMPTQEAKPKPTPGRPKDDQEDRIAQGAKTGQLKPGETASVEKKEAATNGGTKAGRADNDGKLTAAEKKPANKEQSGASKSSDKKKNDDKTPPAKPQS